MPNITIGGGGTLSGIPGVLNAGTMTQAGANDCGAYALVAAVGAHGVFPVNANTPLAYVNAGPQAVNLNAAVAAAHTYPQLSAQVYAITGILNNAAGAVPVVPELLAAGNVYNSPAAMAQVAMNLGRTVQINVQAAGFGPLNNLYPGEQARCTAVVGGGNVDVNAGAYGAPAPNETHVVCVDTGGGLHWLARGTNGDFYDPANGTLNNNWAPTNTGDPLGGNYTFTGLWMVIT